MCVRRLWRIHPLICGQSACWDKLSALLWLLMGLSGYGKNNGWAETRTELALSRAGCGVASLIRHPPAHTHSNWVLMGNRTPIKCVKSQQTNTERALWRSRCRSDDAGLASSGTPTHANPSVRRSMFLLTSSGHVICQACSTLSRNHLIGFCLSAGFDLKERQKQEGFFDIRREVRKKSWN